MCVNKPASAWPSLTLHWTLETAEWIYSFDGEFPDWVKNDELLLGWAPTALCQKQTFCLSIQAAKLSKPLHTH